MATANDYVRTDEHGVMRVGDSRVMLESVVAAFEQGHSPETIRSQYPSLTLEEVYGAITYCLAHAEEVKAYLQRQGAIWDEWQSRAGELASPTVDRLRRMRGVGAKGG